MMLLHSPVSLLSALQAATLAHRSAPQLAQFIARLQTDFGATINEAALAQVIGGANN